MKGGKSGDYDLAVDLFDARAAAKSHRHVQFLVDDLQAAEHAFLSQGPQAVEKGTSYQGSLGTQGQRLEHALPRAYAAVHPHLDAIADLGGDGRQRLDRTERPVELPAAMVGHD